ncbi:hypothetical protein [Massilia sp. YIM B04103]|uniref:hypothetical protein n=1 Tax=Massilia sp. YIM B04103 TaxID=2963106 RepID=UPI002108605A|nr:hypothetical protein [Massilia sp. YIM B04103]
MERRLIDYRPELELPASGHGQTPGLHGPDLRFGVELLSARRAGRIHAFLHALASLAGIDATLARVLANYLYQDAQRVFPSGVSGDLRPGARLLGVELEGLSPEDKEFELARQFIRYANHAACRLSEPTEESPEHAVALALSEAASRFAPGLLRNRGGPNTLSGAASPLNPQQFHPPREHIMHDIDRTTLEFGQEASFEAEQYEFGETEWSGEGGILSEAQELELANELLSVSNEAELEQFLGNVVRSFTKFVPQIVNSPLTQAVGGVLKGVAKKALPLAGGALGGMIGGPLGARIGSGLASAAGSALGLEAEQEMSNEDREFEGARTFVKLAADTVNRASQAGGGDPRKIAMQAAMAAARQFAPGLLAKAGMAGYPAQPGLMGRPVPASYGVRGSAGRWVRRGRSIVLYGV